MLEAFLDHLHCVDACFIAPDTLEKLATPAQLGKTRVGGVDPNKPRMRAALGAVLALAPSPKRLLHLGVRLPGAGNHRTERTGIRSTTCGLRPEENSSEGLGYQSRPFPPLLAALAGTQKCGRSGGSARKGYGAPLGRHRHTETRPETQKLELHRSTL